MLPMVMGRLGLEAYFALVTNCEDADFIGGNDKAIEGNVSGMTIGNNQFAQFTFDPLTDQRFACVVSDL
jgi:hypothetical protein